MFGTVRFYGWTENDREVKMDMREMVDKVKKGEPLYGSSDLTPYMQGVAARNSRYTALMAHVVPWANFVNHNQVGLVYFPRSSLTVAARCRHRQILPASRTRIRSRKTIEGKTLDVDSPCSHVICSHRWQELVGACT